MNYNNAQIKSLMRLSEKAGSRIDIIEEESINNVLGIVGDILSDTGENKTTLSTKRRLAKQGGQLVFLDTKTTVDEATFDILIGKFDISTFSTPLSMDPKDDKNTSTLTEFYIPNDSESVRKIKSAIDRVLEEIKVKTK